MVSFEIYFSDLNEKAQRELMELVHIKDPSEMNWDIDMSPLAIYETDDDEDNPTETECINPGEGYKVMMEAGTVRQPLVTCKTKEEAIEFCKDNNWIWIDENQFEWDLYIDE